MSRCLQMCLIGSWVLASVSVLCADDKPKENVEKITYDDHVQAIFRQHCNTCHNANDAEGGLALDSFGKAMEGGSSGKVIVAGESGESRLWKLINHEDTPKMPPEQDKLPAEQLAVVEKWINLGALENKGSKFVAKKKKSFSFAGGGEGKPEGPAAAPAGVLKQPVVYSDRAAAVTAVASSPWAPVVAIAGQKQIVLYDSNTAKCLGVLPFPEGIPYVLKFSRNGELLLAGGGRGGQSGSVSVYSVRTGKRVLKVGDEYDCVFAADINNDHTRIALAGPKRLIRIYDTATGELVHEIKKHTDWVYSIAFSPDGVLLASSDRSNGLFVWEADTARQYLDLRGHSGPIHSVAWRPDSNVLASASEDSSVKLWEMNEGKQVKSWNAHGGGTNSVAFTHDGHIVTSGNDKTVKMWDGNGAAKRTFPAFGELALRAVFSHDGKRVIGGDWNGDVRLWEAADGAPVATLKPNPPTLAMRVDAAATQAKADQAAAATALAAYQAKQAAVTDYLNKVKAAEVNVTTVMAAATKAEAAHQAMVKAATDLAAKLKDATAGRNAAKSVQDKAQAEKKQADAAVTEKTAAAAAATKAATQAQTPATTALQEYQAADQALVKATEVSAGASGAAQAATEIAARLQADYEAAEKAVAAAKDSVAKATAQAAAAFKKAAATEAAQKVKPLAEAAAAKTQLANTASQTRVAKMSAKDATAKDLSEKQNAAKKTAEEKAKAEAVAKEKAAALQTWEGAVRVGRTQATPSTLRGGSASLRQRQRRQPERW